MLRRTIQAMTETAVKKQKMAGPLIGTHSGTFHADEALAVYMLRMLPTYAASPLIRTRDPAKLQECHTVVDVGGQYDPPTHRYDHHQREFTATFPGRATKLSSAGLVFLHMGKRVIATHTGLPEDSAEVTQLHEKLYADFIEAFDANDNGVALYDPSALETAGIPRRFNDRGFTLASVVGRMNRNPSSDTAPRTPEQTQADEDARFATASAFAGGQFESELSDAHRSWLPARKIVADAFASRATHDPSGRVLVLPHRDGGLPWSDHLDALEAEAGAQGEVLYVLFPESGSKDSKWRVRAVSRAPGSFETRRPLPEKWRGVRDEELSGVAGVAGCVFVHASGFIGGNETFEGALQMARIAAQ